MRMGKSVGLTISLATPALALAPRVASACAVCGLGPNDVGGHAFNSSVLFMMAVPYATCVLIGGVVYWTWRKAAHRRDDSATIQ